MPGPGVPRSHSDVDAAWLTQAMQQVAPGTEVQRVELLKLVHGAATKAHLRVSYGADPSGLLPSELWVKAGWEAHSGWLAGMGTYLKEAAFYSDFRPRVPILTPRCFYSCTATDGNSVVVLEDLVQRGAVLNTCVAGVSTEQMSRSLDNLARLHARWWNDPMLDERTEIDLPMRSEGVTSDWPRRNGPKVMERFLERPRGAGVPVAVRDPVRIDRAFWNMLRDMPHARPFVLLHGDPHPNNTFVDADGEPGLYDWQTLSRGPWAYDVAYHIVSSLSTEDRRRNDRALLQHYLERLAAHGVSQVPTWDAAWEGLRGYIAYGLHIWLTNPEPFQSEESCTALVARLAAAAEDYDFFARWGV